MTKASDNTFPSLLLEEVATDGSATGTPAADYRRLFLGEDGGLHLKDSAAAVTDVGAVAVSEDFTGEVTMTNANQFYDGPTLTPAAGTYFFLGKIVCINNSALVDTLQAKLWDGTTTIDESFDDIAAGLGAGAEFTLVVMGKFTCDGATPVKISVAGGRAGWVIKQNVRANSASSGKASRLECWPCS